jgi:hypothetical protein
MNEHNRAESECTFEELKEEHRRALEAEDIEGWRRCRLSFRS